VTKTHNRALARNLKDHGFKYGHGCQGREIFFRDMLVEFRESRLMSQEIAVSADKTYDFVVVSNWYNDYTIKVGDRVIDNKSNQLSIGYWKDGWVVKESYNYPVLSTV
jgi:hypothetical protein